MRVLALASRPFSPQEDLQGERAAFEQRLEFQGFLVTHSILKWDTKSHLDMLRAAHFQIMMITGDNLMTAMAVAQQLNMRQIGATSKDTSTLLIKEGQLTLSRRSVEDKVIGE